VIHACVVMSNHYHLAVETPEGNLVSGMASLQGRREMKRATTTTNPWIAKALGMGHPSRVCNLVNGI
jgi:REP element-mobilizing transposase RayT